MGITRITKKLVPALQDIDGAVLVLNAKDPQFATFALFRSAVLDLPYIIVVNKCDEVTKDEVDVLVTKFPNRRIILSSMKTGRGLDEIRRELKGFEGKIAVLGIFNSGKSSLINALTGDNAPVDDIPGTTLELTPHNYNGLVLLDTTGQIIDISKPLMVSIDLTECKTVEDKLIHCMEEDALGIMNTIDGALPGLLEAVELIRQRVELGNKVITCGAGASALVAMEIAGQGQETGIPIMVFTNNFSTCQPVSFAKGIGEDEESLARYFSLAVAEGDVVIGASASGGTGFVFRLLELAKLKKAYTIAITENSDTPLGKAADIIIKSDSKPEGCSSSKIQVAHLAIGHALMITLADIRGIDAEMSISFMMRDVTRNKAMGIK